MIKRSLLVFTVTGICLASVDAQHMQMLQQPNYHTSQKFADSVHKRIDDYVHLCIRLAERRDLNIHSVNVLAFTCPSIIRCYNALIRTGDVAMVAQLWQAYKIGSVRGADKTFTYEFCHLLYIILKHHAYQLLGDALLKQQGQQSIPDITATLPMDDLLNLIDVFYQRLMEFLAKEDQQQKEGNWHLPIAKRWVALGIVCLVFAQKAYLKWVAVTTQSGQGSAVSPTH